MKKKDQPSTRFSLRSERFFDRHCASGCNLRGTYRVGRSVATQKRALTCLYVVNIKDQKEGRRVQTDRVVGVVRQKWTRRCRPSEENAPREWRQRSRKWNYSCVSARARERLAERGWRKEKRRKTRRRRRRRGRRFTEIFRLRDRSLAGKFVFGHTLAPIQSEPRGHASFAEYFASPIPGMHAIKQVTAQSPLSKC